MLHIGRCVSFLPFLFLWKESTIPKMRRLTLLALLPSPTALAGALQARQSASQTEAIVDLSAQTGDSRHLASGLLYGIPERPGAIADEFIDKPKINLLRAGGLYLGTGCQYASQVRTGRPPISPAARADRVVQDKCDAVSTVDYQAIRRRGGTFMMLLNDMWAAWAPRDALPGDAGDWASFDAYLAHVIDGIKKNNMTERLQVDIWNEPDWQVRWDQSQYIELYNHAYTAFR